MWMSLLTALVVLVSPVTVDGDTVRAGGETYRVANIDAPESGWRAQCLYERRLAVAASEFVRQEMAAARRVEALPVGRRDRYGRVVAHLHVDGEDLGERMIALGLAQEWRGRRANWCGQDGLAAPARVSTSAVSAR